MNALIVSICLNTKTGSYSLNLMDGLIHGLVNYTEPKAFVGFSKNDLQENFKALIYYPSRRKCIHWKTGGVGGGGVSQVLHS
jgi:hypothetical protein